MFHIIFIITNSYDDRGGFVIVGAWFSLNSLNSRAYSVGTMELI